MDNLNKIIIEKGLQNKKYWAECRCKSFETLKNFYCRRFADSYYEVRVLKP